MDTANFLAALGLRGIILRVSSQTRDLECLRDRERGINVNAQLRAAIAPVHQLPAELLTEIFLIVLEDTYHFSRRDRIEKVQALCQVCAYWRRVAHTAPRLWTEQLSTKLVKTPTAAYISCVKEWLERSAPIQIPVELEISGKGVAAGPLIDVMAATAPRWKSADFNLRSLSVLSRIPPASLESLEYLSLRSGDKKHHEKITFFVTAERLHRASLYIRRTSRLLMPWSQLTQLRVTDLSPQECLDTLVQCTSLISATFETTPWPDFPDLSQRPISTLGCLKDLYVDFEPSAPGCVTPFFACLALPALTTLTLALDIMHIWSSEEFTQFQLGSPNIEELTLERSPMGSGDLLAMLQHAPSLVALDMRYCLYSFDESIFRGLQYSTASAVHLAPRLERLRWTYIGTDFDEDALDAMIQSRWWTDKQLLALPSPPTVSRWSSVDILCSDDGATHVSPDFSARMEEYRLQGLNIAVS
ncbi:hypothetical protein C8R45DRAFT_1188081 [Mycena sanguinolenta]|nr:hypothetical protein C8R45DRAFT_1188081 [Mycena sanguinolenta]